MPKRLRILAMVGAVMLASLVAPVASSAGEVRPRQMIAECANTYRFVPTLKTWSEARDAARAMGPGAHLATISSWDENVCVRMSINLVMTTCASSFRLGGGCAPEIVWLGGSDGRAEGIWRWLGTSGTGGGVFFNEDRNVSAYTNWSAFEPNDSEPGEDCLLMFTDTAAWNDGTCDSRAGFVVEFERRTPRRGNVPA